MNEVFLKSEKVFFRPYQSGDEELIQQWYNNPEVTYFMFIGQLPTTVTQVKTVLENDINSGNIVFIVGDLKNNAIIGLVGLYDLHPASRKAEMRVIIGDKKYWNKGYGTEITKLITFYGFDRLNLNRIQLGFTADNLGAQRAYEKAGYVKEGVLRKYIYRNSQYYDSVLMSILRDDYYSQYYNEHKQIFSVCK